MGARWQLARCEWPPPHLLVSGTTSRAPAARSRHMGAPYAATAQFPPPLALHPNLGLLEFRVFNNVHTIVFGCQLSSSSWRVPRATGALSTKATRKSGHEFMTSTRHKALMCSHVFFFLFSFSLSFFPFPFSSFRFLLFFFVLARASLTPAPMVHHRAGWLA